MTLADSLGPLIERVRTDVTAVKGNGAQAGTSRLRPCRSWRMLRVPLS